jgi:hypothetical protein
MLDRIVEASSSTVTSAYEKRIEELEREKIVWAERRANGTQSKGSFEPYFELAMAFLASSCKIW